MATMSPLRRRMIDDMMVRNLSPATQQSYIYAVRESARRKMSATSSTGRMRADHSGGVTARLKRSRGLVVAAIRLVATCA